jgi:ubiquinone/menaquinone biosynthesis C-methylase UbiE
MKLLHPENPMEWFAVKAMIVPVPFIDGFCYVVESKAFNTALKLEIFETMRESPQTIEQIADKTGFNPKALSGVLNVLTIPGYIKYKNGKYEITKLTRKWCLKDSPDTLYRSAGHFELECRWMDHLDEYLNTGKGIGIHDHMNEEEWNSYQIGMEDIAALTAKTAAKKTPMPANPTEMLDIGGSHGLYCVELCKRYPGLKATILDLPEAVVKAEPLLAKHNMGDRVVFRAGNAVTDDLGENKYDLVMMSSVMHHLSGEDNIQVSRKVARALKPGGHFAVQEYIRPSIPSSKHALSLITDLIFNISSTSNTWNLDEVKEFQRQAGLKEDKINKYIVLPGFIQV